ncbi:MAG: sigma-70 family RNA polymerase sigma factor [Dysosmobacter welbionis]
MPDFEEIYQTYFADVYRYILALSRDAHTAEEVTQETFFRALASIDQFRGDCQLRVWLCQIARNQYLSLCRERKHRGELEQEPGDDGLERGFADRDAAKRLHRLLHDLPEPYKEVFSLRTFGELPFAQIGELFGKTESWARVTYFRARQKLRRDLMDQLDHDIVQDLLPLYHDGVCSDKSRAAVEEHLQTCGVPCRPNGYGRACRRKRRHYGGSSEKISGEWKRASAGPYHWRDCCRGGMRGRRSGDLDPHYMDVHPHGWRGLYAGCLPAEERRRGGPLGFSGGPGDLVCPDIPGGGGRTSLLSGAAHSPGGVV